MNKKYFYVCFSKTKIRLISSGFQEIRMLSNGSLTYWLVKKKQKKQTELKQQ